jgi:iron(III) transport system ATP-binding protein
MISALVSAVRLRSSGVPALPIAGGALTLRGVSKRYPGATHDALASVDLHVPPGGVTAVVGSSGCGKTTLLRLVAGLEVPDAGSIHLGDEEVAGDGAWVQPEARGVGMVFQDFALFPHLKVVDNVAYGLRRRGRRARQERAREILAMVGMEEMAGRYPHQLSGGQQQRVALARALAPEPRVLLLDEPFSNMDLPLKAGLQLELAPLLRRSGVPTLIVVHDIEDVVTLADQVVILRDGKVAREGALARLCQDPGDAYVAGFFERLRTPTGNRFVAASGG